MEEKLKEMLGKRPEELEGETLKLFEAIMKIADERDELRVRNKELEEENETKLEIFELGKESSRKRIEYDYIPKTLIKEKIEELNKTILEYEEYRKAGKETDVEFYDFIANSAIVEFLEELLGEEK